jgi:hypothetical protein
MRSTSARIFAYTPGSAWSVLSARPLLRDQLAMPSENRIRRHDRGHLAQRPAPNLMSDHGETPALTIRKTEALAVELR